jgi:hypothetical protein
MVWMRMGEDDEVDFIRRNPITFHLLKEIGDMLGMAWIDQSGHLSPDQKGVAIILIGIGPEIGIEVFSEFHPSSLLQQVKI